MILTIEQIVAFLLIFTRLASLLTFAPVFSNKEVISMFKISLCFWISALALFFVPLPKEMPNTLIMIMLAVIIELLIGAILGFLSQVFVSAINVGGAIMDTQAGLSVASLLDPSTGSQTTIIARMTSLIALLIFLIIDGHHIIFSILIQSFQVLPVASPYNAQAAIRFLLDTSVNIFAIGLQISAPILLVVFLIDFGFGMLSRVAPQVNVFQLGFQLKPIISLLIFLSIIPGMLDIIYYIIEVISSDLIQTLFLLRV